MAAKKNVANRKVKDSVFNNLFSIPKYRYQLFKQLHPEVADVKESDVEIVTLEHILTNNEYNDLGLLAGDHFLILAEAQSTWSVNILIRFVLYLATTYKDYIEKNKVRLYGTKKAKLPKPELYLIYTGIKGNRPDELSFREEFFGGAETAIEVKAKVIYGYAQKKDVIGQYIEFCKVFDSQVKSFGRTKKAIEETISICSDKDVLKEYLEAHRKEVVDIMTQLYDAEREMKLYVEEEREDAAKKAVVENIKNLMDSLKLTAAQAMNALKIPSEDRKKYKSMLSSMNK
ncbi:MAG: hypothetical protein IKS11_04010 [Lachnospiraceae bacterium]|nr:hypothetical protein [Lachnospiraceae bacterium]